MNVIGDIIVFDIKIIGFFRQICEVNPSIWLVQREKGYAEDAEHDNYYTCKEYDSHYF